VTEVQPGHQVEFTVQEGRQAYVLCVEGTARFEGAHGEEVLEQHDAAEVFGPNTLSVSSTDATVPAHVLLVEMAYTGVGRTDL
jgi:redox-sensitive bicupin YhaK (pirin superfamily)